VTQAKVSDPYSTTVPKHSRDFCTARAVAEEGHGTEHFDGETYEVDVHEIVNALGTMS